ncbi:DNA polymerase III subunit gamma/tau [Isorropodon fossajaponicum endosymbiont JTNG4]|uniref:DNA polymerase III subunit gamma/tau n=1 Tax=Isorropodon fossajaponicum symbiont TaxID=883811 RepID=UPI0019169320|nr:DNA polymerase III subunit gamma/tau [Isorropodon fossajaponicum symbiont]BBB24177.1 DNA polymerase III subunit gamma/tau [Isorropodon fossajaponicum endosymbiont JTNG4]
MSEHYQVLARKYRPHSFAGLVGQTHTKKTLINALDANNLHHGFLFTGTRGVGKTTIARIFAKSINCEQGISSKPCGKCSTCIEIDQGQSIDLIELDAASHTGVDNMRDILENAQYMPSKNRYKIYLIDEVHMLSKSSFNALLKTLEEPPEHIKFLLATTDPQKLPVTILSRCLQFTLQQLTHDEILGQLKFIMDAEALSYEESALGQIADFGNGSMRDALSLLDQSISYGKGTVTNADIKAMLGLVHHDDIIKLATHLFSQDAKAVIDFIKDLSHRGENLSNALKDLSSLFHKISIAQIVNTESDKTIQNLGTQISNFDLQIFYQMSINGSKDMALAPSEQIGFEMTLLRMLAFRSDTQPNAEKKTLKIKLEVKTPAPVKEKSQPKAEEKPDIAKPATLDINNQQQWETLTQTLKFKGGAQILVKNTLFDNANNATLTLTLDSQFANLLSDQVQKSILTTLRQKFSTLSLVINLGKPNTQALAQKQTQAHNEKMVKIQTQFLNDKGVQKLEKTFDTKININSIKEISHV